MVSREKGGLYVDDDAVKKALTDAIGVAAKMIGLGSDVYSGNEDWSKYSNAYKPSENPPQQEKTHATKEEQAAKYTAIITWMDSGDATESEIAGMIARSAELVNEGTLTQRDQRKIMAECLIRCSEWDDAQAHLVRCENNSYLTKKQVAKYMEWIDAGRSA